MWSNKKTLQEERDAVWKELEGFRLDPMSSASLQRNHDLWTELRRLDRQLRLEEEQKARTENPLPFYPAPESDAPRARKRLDCGYCDGLGWYYCRRCRGMGETEMPNIRYTGDRVADGLIDALYANSRRCPVCNGKREIVCSHCNGTGKQP